MKQLPAGMQAHLDGGATTLCWCWRLTRRDGVRYGFTDHDRDIAFDNTGFEAASGFAASELAANVGLAADNSEAAGALQSDRLGEAELAMGLYDDARVEVFRVNWQEPEQRILMSAGSLGEVKRGRHGFKAEVRGLAHYLQQPGGRLIQYACDAMFADARCGLDAGSGSPWRAEGTVVAAGSRHAFIAAGLEEFASGWFSRGLLTWQSGANAPASMEVKQHFLDESGAVAIELWQDMPFDIAAGDAFTLLAGCDKQFATCRDRFNNQHNFRGFPHVPGNDFIVSYPGRDDAANDGSSLVS
jgi:uncharacterized phage protein (TIGR02218 family)